MMAQPIWDSDVGERRNNGVNFHKVVSFYSNKVCRKKDF